MNIILRKSFLFLQQTHFKKTIFYFTMKQLFKIDFFMKLKLFIKTNIFLYHTIFLKSLKI